MKLRMVAERVYGHTPGGTSSARMMELMLQQERGNVKTTSLNMNTLVTTPVWEQGRISPHLLDHLDDGCKSLGIYNRTIRIVTSYVMNEATWKITMMDEIMTYIRLSNSIWRFLALERNTPPFSSFLSTLPCTKFYFATSVNRDRLALFRLQAFRTSWCASRRPLPSICSPILLISRLTPTRV